MPKNGASGQLEPPGQPADVALLIERDMHEPRLVEVVLQRAGERADDVEAPVLPQLHVEDLDLQHVTRLRALDRDRAGQDVRAARKALGAGVHLGKLRRNVKAGFRNELGRAAERVDGDAVAAVDRQQRLARRRRRTPSDSSPRSPSRDDASSATPHWEPVNKEVGGASSCSWRSERRALLDPAGRGLVGGADAQHGRLVERAARRSACRAAARSWRSRSASPAPDCR